MRTITINGQTIDVERTLDLIEKIKCERNLYDFLKKAWPYIDPAEFVDGWPIQAVAEHLEAVADGQIRRLIINIPPRSMKSTLCSVAFPAWVWIQPEPGPTSGPGVKFLTGSYAADLATRDSVKARSLIDSPWYQKHWGQNFKFAADQNLKTRYRNSKGGERLITSVDAKVTGEGGDIIIIDDPNSAQEAFSEQKIENTITWWDGAISTRLNNAKTGAYIIIQQRLSEEDLTGHILEKQIGDWTHLCLPMRYEWNRHSATSIGWNDPRGCDDEGEPLVLVDDGGVRYPRDAEAQDILINQRERSLLWPARFGETEVQQLESTLGPWMAAGQLQQRPEPEGGGIIKRDWWKLWEGNQYPLMDYVVAFVDGAYTTKTENDPSAMVVMGIFSGDNVAQNHKDGRGTTSRSYAPLSPRVMLMLAWSKRLEIHELIQEVAKTCKDMKVDKVLIENKATGISVAQELRRLFSHEDFMVQLIDPKGMDKVARLYSVQHLFAEGMVFSPDRTWSNDVMTQCATFPKGKHDDLVDCTSGVLRHLRDLGLLQRVPEITAELRDSMKFIGKPLEPLYDC